MCYAVSVFLSPPGLVTYVGASHAHRVLTSRHWGSRYSPLPSHMIITTFSLLFLPVSLFTESSGWVWEERRGGRKKWEEGGIDTVCFFLFPPSIHTPVMMGEEADGKMIARIFPRGPLLKTDCRVTGVFSSPLLSFLYRGLLFKKSLNSWRGVRGVTRTSVDVWFVVVELLYKCIQFFQVSLYSLV